MGVEKREVVTYTCDRCGFQLDGEEIRRDEAVNCGPSSREFHVFPLPIPERHIRTLVDPNSPRAWLCADCVRLHRAFMTGAQLV